jgi:hypothetical protein
MMLPIRSVIVHFALVELDRAQASSEKNQFRSLFTVKLGTEPDHNALGSHERGSHSMCHFLPTFISPK